MRDYGRVAPTFWTGETGKAIRRRGSEAVIVAMYLMTSPHSNMLGLYYQPKLYMAHETGLGIEGAEKGLQGCIEAEFCSYDTGTEMVWVHEMAKWQIASELKADDKRCKGIQKDYLALPNCPFLGEFFDRYRDAFHLTNRRSHEGPSQAPSQAPSKPGTGTGTGTSTGTSPSQSSGEGAAAQRAPRPRKVECTLSTYLETCKAEGKKPLPADHAIRAYCRDAGISDEMLQVAWCVFRDDYTAGTNKAKRYKDWPGHFANAVRGCWHKIWYTDPVGGVTWTSRGLQEKAVLDARAKAKGGDHGAA